MDWYWILLLLELYLSTSLQTFMSYRLNQLGSMSLLLILVFKTLQRTWTEPYVSICKINLELNLELSFFFSMDHTKFKSIEET